MRILMINPPHPAIGSRIPHEHLPPLGLLSIGGPLLDDGHEVELLDADLGPLKTQAIIARVELRNPEVILIGHSGSTSAHPVVLEITRAIKQSDPHTKIIYGGVFPTYHWKEILEQAPQIDLIVCGEGEETTRKLITALETSMLLEKIPGIAYRKSGNPIQTAAAPIISNLDAYRVGWELIDFSKYSYWGDKRAVVVQFSRGCPHQCNYCGQRHFWKRWRHHDPVKFAAELARLHREFGVQVINFADENPTASKRVWQQFLDALIKENVDLRLVGSTRADDIVRDADILHLYKKAGIARFLLGIESYKDQTLTFINKGGSECIDRQAIQLLREHGIISMATYVVGFDEETDRDYLYSLKQLLIYDPDQIQMLYATPHRWTPFFGSVENRRVIQMEQSKWDYKHQVLATTGVPPWRVFLWVKLIEAIMQLRPRSLIRLLLHPDSSFRSAMKWYYRIGRRVWPYEIVNFFISDHITMHGARLMNFWQEGNEEDKSWAEPETGGQQHKLCLEPDNE